MKERQQAQDDLSGFPLLRDAVQHGLALPRVAQEIGVGQHHALGYAGGAAGVLQQGQIFLRIDRLGRLPGRAHEQAFPGCDAGRAVRNVGQPVFTPGFEHVKQMQWKAQTVGYGRDEDAFEPQTRAQAVYALPEQIEGDEGGGPGIVEVMNQLLFHVQGVGHDHHGSEPETGPIADDGLGTVGEHDGYPVAGPDAGSSQVGAGQIHQNLELSVAYAPVVEDQGRASGMTFGRAGQYLVHADMFVAQIGRDFLVVMLEPDAAYSFVDHDLSSKDVRLRRCVRDGRSRCDAPVGVPRGVLTRGAVASATPLYRAQGAVASRRPRSLGSISGSRRTSWRGSRSQEKKGTSWSGERDPGRGSSPARQAR